MYLGVVRSLHIDQGLPNPLVNCLQLQRLRQGIKLVQGSSPTKRLPVIMIHTYIHTYIPNYLPAYLPNYLPTYLPTLFGVL